jgi:8-oxo-dGTP pyrophosphatase MutT (NUDIX family)
MRRPEEVFVVVHRANARGREYLVLERSPERHGYWHLVSGALEAGEEPEEAARRELAEEVGLGTSVHDLGKTYVYPLAGEPSDVRARFAPDATEVSVTSFTAEAEPGWEPTLDAEHVAYRWCSADDAIALLRYPEPRDAVARADERLRRGR